MRKFNSQFSLSFIFFRILQEIYPARQAIFLTEVSEVDDGMLAEMSSYWIKEFGLPGRIIDTGNLYQIPKKCEDEVVFILDKLTFNSSLNLTTSCPMFLPFDDNNLVETTLTSEVFRYRIETSNNSIIIEEEYSIKGFVNGIMNFVGVYDVENDELIWTNLQIDERRKDLRGYTIKECGLPYAPFYMKNEDGLYEGYFIDILKSLQMEMNFTLYHYEPEDGLWGGTYENGSFKGIVGQIQVHII